MQGSQHFFPLEAISFHKAKYLSMQPEQNKVEYIPFWLLGCILVPEQHSGKHYDKHQDTDMNETGSLPSRSSQSNEYNE